MRSNHKAFSFVLALVTGAAAIAQAPSAETSIATAAAAKLLESKGDFAGAARLLEHAIALAPDEQFDQRSAQLSRLRAQQEPRVAKQDKVVDPVDRLIAVLNHGYETPEVESAVKQLESLGSLVVPQLIRAFPDLGPFGLRNALQVMHHVADARIGQFLAQQLRTGSPDVVASVVKSMDMLSAESALLVAAEVAAGDFTESQQLAALNVYQSHRPEDQQRVALQEKLLSTGSPRTRAHAAAWAISAGEMAEAEAVAVVKELPPELQAQVCHVVKQKDWVQLGMLGLASAGKHLDMKSHLLKFEWWRAADEAAPLLLDVRSSSSYAVMALEKMIGRGWHVPERLDPAFCAYAKRNGPTGRMLFVQALPVDAEERALKLCDDDPSLLLPMVQACRHLNPVRQWTRLVVRYILSVDDPESLMGGAFKFDWSKAPQDAIDGLIQFAERWPTAPSVPCPQWAQELVTAYTENAALPAEVMRPLVRSGNYQAGSAVMKRDPEAGLAMLRGDVQLDRTMFGEVAQAILFHGTAKDVPLAIRWLRQAAVTGTSYVNTTVLDFLTREAKGNPEALRLAERPSKVVWGGQSGQSEIDRMAEAVAADLSVRDLPAILEMLPTLPHHVVEKAVFALAPQLTAKHVEALATALRRCFVGPWTDSVSNRRGPSAVLVGSRTLASFLMHLLGQTGSETALPHLRRVYEDKDVSELMIQSAARAALQVAGSSRKAVLAEMLQSEQRAIVAVAAQAEELRVDDELQALAFAGVLRCAQEKSECWLIFDAVDQDDQRTFAKAVLDHKDLAQFDSYFLSQALKVLDGTKDARYLPQLSRAAQHPSNPVRLTAAKMLGNTFIKEAAAPLLDMLKDDDAKVRMAATESLDQIAHYLDERASWESRFGK